MNYMKTVKTKIFIEKTPEELESAINAFIQSRLYRQVPGFKVISLAIAFQWTASLLYEIYEEVKDEQDGQQPAADSTDEK